MVIIPKTEGNATPLGQRPLSVLPIENSLWATARLEHLQAWCDSWLPQSVFSAGKGRSSFDAWYSTSLDIEESVGKSLGAVDRNIFDCVLLSVGLTGWFRHAHFEYHARVRTQFKLAAGLGEPWTRDGGIPQGCPLGMMLMVAFYLPWCHGLAEREGVVPLLYAENLKCASRDSGDLLAAAQFTSRYIRLVGQDVAPSIFVLLTTCSETRDAVRDWDISGAGDRWSVRLDVRDLEEEAFGFYLSWWGLYLCCWKSSSLGRLESCWCFTTWLLGYFGFSAL